MMRPLCPLLFLSLLVGSPVLVPSAGAADGPGPLLNPIAAVSLDALSVFRDRPLFSPSRRPPALPPPPIVMAAPPPPPLPPPTVSLYGIVADRSGARALVRPSPTEKISRVKLGDELGGWRVTQIGRRNLVLSHEERTATFTLFDKNAGRSATLANDEPRRRRRRSSD